MGKAEHSFSGRERSFGSNSGYSSEEGDGAQRSNWTLPVWSAAAACTLSKTEGVLNGQLQYMARVQGVDGRTALQELGAHRDPSLLHLNEEVVPGGDGAAAMQGSPAQTVPLHGDTALTLHPPPGTGQCRDRAVLTGTDLQLLLEEPLPSEWSAIVWKVALEAKSRQRILTVRKDKVEPASSSLSQRATSHRGTLTLQISAVTQADNATYYAEIENSTGSVWTKCFHVTVWEPMGSPRLETRVLQQEQGRCHLQLSCTVPRATNVSYSWSRDGEPVGNQSVLEVPKDVPPGLYVCNVSNLANWSTASINTTMACTQTGLFAAIQWWALTVVLVLAVCIASSITYWYCRRRRKDHPAAPTPPAPPEHTEPSLTVYEEVGKAQTDQEPNRNSEVHVVGNTIYAVVHPKGQRSRSPQKPESCTIYSTVQHRMSPSFKRKKLDPALVSTAYMEVTAPWRRC